MCHTLIKPLRFANSSNALKQAHEMGVLPSPFSDEQADTELCSNWVQDRSQGTQPGGSARIGTQTFDSRAPSC